MKFLVMLYVTLMMSFSALAGVEVSDSRTGSLKVKNKIQCGPGIQCTHIKGGAELNVGDRPMVAMQSGAAQALVASQCGSTVTGPTGTGAVEVDLPQADTLEGCWFTFVSMGTGNFDLDPAALDTVLALTNAAGDKIRNATAGNSVTLQAVPGSGWAAVGIYGTWSDAN